MSPRIEGLGLDGRYTTFRKDGKLVAVRWGRLLVNFKDPGVSWSFDWKPGGGTFRKIL